MSLDFQGFDNQSAFDQDKRQLPHRSQPGCCYFLTWRLEDSVPQDVMAQWLTEREEFYARNPHPWSARVQANYNEQFPRRLERWADAGRGSCVLADPDIRAFLTNALHHFDNIRYDLDSYVVMPNHVHVLVRPYTEHDVDLLADAENSKTGNDLVSTPDQCVTDIPVCNQEPSTPAPSTAETDSGISPHRPLITDKLRSREANVCNTLRQPSSLSKITQVWKGFSAREINKALGRTGTLWMDESFDHAVRSVRQLLRFRSYIGENPAKAGLNRNQFAHYQKRDSG